MAKGGRMGGQLIGCQSKKKKNVLVERLAY